MSAEQSKEADYDHERRSAAEGARRDAEAGGATGSPDQSKAGGDSQAPRFAGIFDWDAWQGTTPSPAGPVEPDSATASGSSEADRQPAAVVAHASGARLFYDKRVARPVEIQYPDGTRRQFGYDASGLLGFVREPSGTGWTRTGSVGPRGFAQWTSTDGDR